MKQQTIPKLDLPTELNPVRLRELNNDGHDINIAQGYHWTDSVTELQWIIAAHKKQ